MKKPKNTFLANYWPMLVGIAVTLVLAIAIVVPNQSSTKRNDFPQDAQSSATSESQNGSADTSGKSSNANQTGAAPGNGVKTSNVAYDECTQATKDLQVAVKDMNRSLENRTIVGNTIHVVNLSKDVWNDFVDASAPYLVSTDYDCAASDSTTTLRKTEQSVRKVITKVKEHQKTFEQALEKTRNYIADNPPSDSASRETVEYRIHGPRK